MALSAFKHSRSVTQADSSQSDYHPQQRAYLQMTSPGTVHGQSENARAIHFCCVLRVKAGESLNILPLYISSAVREITISVRKPTALHTTNDKSMGRNIGLSDTRCLKPFLHARWLKAQGVSSSQYSHGPARKLLCPV